jgi:tetratricopeptide (TPR) repeat protein
VLALIGLSEESDLGGDRRNEAFAAWRRFFEAMADRRPFVLVVEDLHWADESLLDFLDELVDWVTDVPLLVVGTARPELLERRPGWGGGKLNATTLAVEPLTDDETAVLMGALLDRPVLAAEAQDALLERAGGNPLYAEQFAELFLEQGSAEALSLPETLQGIISARLDALHSDEKELLRDASVVGKVFWTGALRRDPAEVGAALHSLSRKAFVRQQRRTSVEGESEFAFAHALVRDVAYAQIARADRAARHRRTAEWIESLGRPEDHAEMLAHHWRSALELAQAAGTETDDLALRAGEASGAAGDRAYALNAFATAAGHYGTALELVSGSDPARPELLFKHARALFLAGDAEADGTFERARDALVSTADFGTAAECEAFIARICWFRGGQQDVFEHLRAAEALIARAEPSPSVARVLGWLGRQEMLAGEYESGLQHGEQALALAERLELDDLRVHALTTIGSAKAFMGDMTGRDDIERAIEIGRAANSTMVAGALNNLAVVIDMFDLPRVRQIQQEALHEAERFGDALLIRFLRGNLIAPDWVLGAWDDALATADRFIAECEESPHILESPSRLFRGYMRLARGDREEALEDLRRGVELARETSADAQNMAPALIRSAWGHLQVGQIAEAEAEVSEALTLLRTDPYARPWAMAEVAVDVGEGAAMREIVEQLLPSPGRSAMLAVIDGRFAEAAEHYAEAGILLFEAEARLRNAAQLIAAGRREEGAPDLERALDFYRSVGATLFVQRGEALLAAAAQSESA